MSTRSMVVRGAIIALVVAVLAAATYVLLPGTKQHTVVAYFTSTTSIYEGDDVRVLGVKVGTIDSIEPEGDRAKVTMSVDADQPVPADAKALIVAQSLVSSRFVQLAPVYDGGPVMADNAVLNEDRTAVPVEWDEIKDQLGTLATALGPNESSTTGALGETVNSAAAALDGNGQSLRQTLNQLSLAMKTLSDGRDDLFSIVRNLQVFVSALAASDRQIVEFGGRLASVSDVLAKNTTALGGALADLNIAVGDVERFVRSNRTGLSEAVSSLADVTQVLADKRPEVERILHSGPNSLANFFNIYQPGHNSLVGNLAISNFQNPVNFICGGIAGLATAAADQSAKLCVQYLAPYLNTLNFNYPALGLNPVNGYRAEPTDLQLSEPGLDVATGTLPAADKPGAPGYTGVKWPTVAEPKVPGLTGLLMPEGGR
ncbi:MCE family protein [Rhodococcus sp. X156]|uniref:MCE family protein n=1 Tax=Rhodococcus sp. X156 TaxID=2499145 RepID=UPI000FDB680E|nr:MCE family protein [Rhodococcus sp. X156]